METRRGLNSVERPSPLAPQLLLDHCIHETEKLLVRQMGTRAPDALHHVPPNHVRAAILAAILMYGLDRACRSLLIHFDSPAFGMFMARYRTFHAPCCRRARQAAPLLDGFETDHGICRLKARPTG